jgi:hypothetical protein
MNPVLRQNGAEPNGIHPVFPGPGSVPIGNVFPACIIDATPSKATCDLARDDDRL